MKNAEVRGCVIQIDGGDGLFFVGDYGRRTPDINKAMRFVSELSAYEYVDKYGLDRLAKVRKIVKSNT